MAANVDRTQYANAIKTNYERMLLERALPNLYHGKWGEVATLNGFGSYELRRYESLSAITTSLDEGVTPDENAAPDLSVITITPLWYGSWLQFTQQLDQVGFDPIVAEMSMILGEQAGLSADTLIRNHVTGAATVRYSGTATARTGIDTTNDMIAYADIIKGVAALAAENARPVSGGFYAGLTHPHTWAKLMRDTTFLGLFQRETGNSPLRSGLIGTILNVQVWITSNSRIYTDGGASNAEVYTFLIFGARAYGLVGMAGLAPNFNPDGSGPDVSFGGMTGQNVNSVSIIRRGLGETGFDPLNQRGTVGYKFAHEEGTLQALFMVVIEHANDFS